MKKARYYKEMDDKRIQCLLCPHYCVIAEGHRGNCLVRLNRAGELYTEVDEKYSGVHLDPIEKKPLYHFFPGSTILSVGTKGCNLKCKYCQNHMISQCLPGDFPHMVDLPYSSILNLAQGYHNCIGVAYTYNEPVVFFETVLALARRVQGKGMKNVMVTNGYVNEEPLEKLLEVIDAFNVDLKAFNNDFYKRYTHGTLEPVLKTIKSIGRSGRHMELTNLVIPGLNSDKQEFEEMVRWISSELGNDMVLHISRYFPAFQMSIDPTPIAMLMDLYEIARKYLNYVYVGNVTSSVGSDSHCSECGQELIRRIQYRIQNVGLKQGKCLSCGHQVIPTEYTL